MILLPRSVISRRVLYCKEEREINRKETSCRTGKGPFSCLESSYSSEALDSFGWRSAVFFAGVSDFFTLRLFFMLPVGGSFLASIEAACTLLCSFFSLFSFGFFPFNV